MRFSGAEMPTSANRSMARLRAAVSDRLRWVRMVSISCSPTRYSGLRLVSGSWKIMPIRLPRIRRISSGGRLSIRSPERWISPPAMRPGGSIRPITARPVTDLPAPDSPTTPSTSPLAMSKEMPSIACSTLRRVANSTLRLRTERTASVMRRDYPGLPCFSSQFRIERVAQPVAEQVDRQDQGGESKAREGDDPPFAGEQIIVADPDQRAQRGHGVGHAGAEERQRGFGDDREREIDGGDHQHRSHRVRQHMPQQDDGGGKADQLRGGDVIAVLLDHDRAAHGAGVLHPETEADREHQ